MSDSHRLRGPVAAFVLGIVLTLTGAVVLFRRGQLNEALARWRYGAAPSQGLVLTLAPAPPELSGSGPGPWLQLELRNVSGGPLPLVFQDPPREEFELRAWDATGRRLDARHDPGVATEARPMRQTELPADGRLAFLLDLSQRVELSGPGPYTVDARRFPLGSLTGGRWCVSNEVELD